MCAGENVVMAVNSIFDIFGTVSFAIFRTQKKHRIYGKELTWRSDSRNYSFSHLISSSIWYANWLAPSETKMWQTAVVDDGTAYSIIIVQSAMNHLKMTIRIQQWHRQWNEPPHNRQTREKNEYYFSWENFEIDLQSVIGIICLRFNTTDIRMCVCHLNCKIVVCYARDAHMKSSGDVTIRR